MRTAIGLAITLIGVMMADSECLLIPIAVVAVGIFLLRKEIWD